MAAAEKGRSGGLNQPELILLQLNKNNILAVAYHHEPEELEHVGDFLRTLALQHDKTYREADGVVLKINQ